MSSAAADVVAAIRSFGWDVRPQDTAPPGEHHLLLVAPPDGPTHPVVVVVHDVPALAVVYSVAPFDVTEERRTDAALFLTLANHGLVQGNFELDLADGEARFKTSLPLDAADLPRALAHQLAFNLAAFATYVPALAAVATGELDPAGAVAAAESGWAGGTATERDTGAG